MSELLPLGTAFLLGFIHALEIDHMMAVTTFVSRRPTLATAFGFGLRWGIGHSLAVFVAGAVLLATGIRWSPGMERILEGSWHSTTELLPLGSVFNYLAESEELNSQAR